MTILITGGTGFLGSYLTRHALEEGAQEHVVILDRHVERGRIANVLDKVTIVEGDVSDYATVSSVIEEHTIDRIAHYAFILGSPVSGQMLPYVRVQTLGTANVFEAARTLGVKRVLFASSVAAYGRQNVEVLTEDLVPNPVEPYGASKVWGESLAKHYASHLGLETVCLRFGSTYGLGRAARGSYKSGMLNVPNQPHYMARFEVAVRGEDITMPRGDALADWSYAADAAQAAWLALTADQLSHQLYNVGGLRGPIGDFTQAMRDVLPASKITVSDTETPGNPHLHMDGTRLGSLGFSPRFTLKRGLEDYLERIRIFDKHSASM